MKRPRNLLAAIFGGLHLAFCILFFALYFSSKDQQRGLLFVLFVPVDPWILLLANALGDISLAPGAAEVVVTVVVTVVGTAQWWAIGWLIGKTYCRIFRKKPNQQGGANGEQPSRSDQSRESPAAAPRRSP